MARRKTTTSTRRGNNTSARRGNSTPSRRGSNTTNTNNETEAGAPPSHRTADQLKGVLRSTTTTVQPDPVQTAADQRRAIQLMPKELDAALGMRRLQLGLDSHQTRQQELARLEIEDPVGHYYAQTPAERAPFQLQAAAVLFEMSGGDVSVPVAALTLMRLRRDEKEMAERKAGAMLLGAWRVGDFVTSSLGCKAN